MASLALYVSISSLVNLSCNFFIQSLHLFIGFTLSKNILYTPKNKTLIAFGMLNKIYFLLETVRNDFRPFLSQFIIRIINFMFIASKRLKLLQIVLVCVNFDLIACKLYIYSLFNNKTTILLFLLLASQQIPTVKFTFINFVMQNTFFWLFIEEIVHYCFFFNISTNLISK